MFRQRSAHVGANSFSSRRPGGGIVLGLVVIPVTLLVLALGIQAAQANSNAAAPGPMKVTSKEQHPLGIPALTPRASLMAASGSRFTRDDVLQYIAAHPQIVQAQPSKPVPIVTQVQFVTAQRASELLHGESIGLADTAPVYVVTVQGSFVFTGAPPSPHFRASTPYTTMTLIFDAHTGNLIITSI